MMAPTPNPAAIRAGRWWGTVVGTGLWLLVVALWIGVLAGVLVRAFRLVNGW